jgi:hypothetical protein
MTPVAQHLADLGLMRWITDPRIDGTRNAAEFVHEHRGLFHYTLTLGDATIPVVMPGRPLQEVRWIDLPGQGRWPGWPSVKVDGVGRPWLLAVRDATGALTGADFTPVEPIRRRLRRSAALTEPAVDDDLGEGGRDGAR